MRQIKFDAMPADLVESVEINKTLQANMDGDGIGGSVNIVTKTAGERPTIAALAVGGTTPIMGGRNRCANRGNSRQALWRKEEVWSACRRFLRLERPRHQ